MILGFLRAHAGFVLLRNAWRPESGMDARIALDWQSFYTKREMLRSIQIRAIFLRHNGEPGATSKPGYRQLPSQRQ